MTENYLAEGDSVVRSVKSPPTDVRPDMPSYVDEELKSSSEFPFINVRLSQAETFVKTAFGSNPTPPESEHTVSTETARRPTITISSSNDTNSLESRNSDVSGFWGGTKMSDAPKTREPVKTQQDSQLPSDEGDTTQSKTFSTSTSGNTESAPSENSQISGFWGESHRPEEGDTADANTYITNGTNTTNTTNAHRNIISNSKTNRKKSASVVKSRNPTMNKVTEDESPTLGSDDSEFWALTEPENSKYDEYEDYETVDNTTMGTVDDEDRKTTTQKVTSRKGSKKKR